jgi:hypothetical protein
MTLNKPQYLICFYILVLFQACAPGRSVSEPETPRPDWVLRRPIIPGYYIGIGWAQKTSNVHQYMNTAKQNALSDLAGEISVTISSNSVLHAFESKLGFREDFSSTIQARTQEELEGFDVVDTWEDQGNYWIYYRLSAAKHKEIKDKRKNDATRISAGMFENALNSRDRGEFRTSLVQFINSMDALKNYFDDPLQVEFRDRDIQLGNEIFNEISATISQIEIVPLQSQIGIKTGQEIPPSLLRFGVKSRTAGPVSDFPLVAAYSERPVRNNRTRTDREGIAAFGIDVVRSSKTYETFTVMPDIESILAEAGTDPMIRRMITRFSLPEGVIQINITKPVITVISNEKNLGEELAGGSLRESFRKNAMEAGYLINENAAESDYIVEITATTQSGGESGLYKNVILTGSVMARLPDGKTIFHREIESIRGSHFDHVRAGEDAFRQAVRRMDSSIFREIDETLKRNAIRRVP